MKIVNLLQGLTTHVNNEERNFLETHPDNVKITSLTDHDQWIAQNLDRKSVYSISKDNNTLIKNLHETNN